MEILNYIPTGSQNAVKRKYLVAATGLKDRDFRDAISEARLKIPIVNLSDGRGYFIPDMNDESDQNKLLLFVMQEESRAKEILARVDVAKQTLRNCGVID